MTNNVYDLKKSKILLCYTTLSIKKRLNLVID